MWRRGWTDTWTYIHEILFHVKRKVLENSHLAHKVLRNFAGGEDWTLAQLCIIMDSPEKIEKMIKYNKKRSKTYKLQQVSFNAVTNFGFS